MNILVSVALIFMAGVLSGGAVACFVLESAIIARALTSEGDEEMASNPMADELFRLAERDAGYAHVSDGVEILDEEQLMKVAESARTHHARCVELLTAFVEHHEQRLREGRPYAPMPATKRRR